MLNNTGDDAQTGHAGDHVEGVVVAEPGLDALVELGDMLVEAHHLLRRRTHQLGGQLLAGQADSSGEYAELIRPPQLSECG